MKLNRICLGVAGDNITIKFAAEEIRKYILMMDNEIMVDILYAEKPDDKYGKVLWLGLGEGFPDVSQSEMDDEVLVCVKENCGYITGTNYRSVLIASYKFLEELGVRWVRPGKEGERVPKKHIGSINAEISETASYRHRGVCIEGAPSFENVYDMIDYLPKISMNTYYFQSIANWLYMENWYSHIHNSYIQKEEVFSDNIVGMIKFLKEEMRKRGIINHAGGHGWTWEAFGEGMSAHGDDGMDVLNDELKNVVAEINGVRGLHLNHPTSTNLCYSNSKAIKGITDAVVKFCIKNHDTDYLHLWLADFPNNHCECNACKEKLPSDWYVILLNKIDDILTEKGISTKLVFLIYYDLLWAPKSEKLKNPERFVLMFAPASRVYGDSYGNHLNFDKKVAPFDRNKNIMPKNLAENIAHLRNWQNNFKGDSFAYEYHLMWAHSGDIGYENCAKNLCEDIKDLEKIGLNGFVSAQSQKTFFPSALPFYIMGKTLWNKEIDFEKEANKYYFDAFGCDGGMVREYLLEISSLINLYEQQVFGDKSAPYGPFCTDYKKLLSAVSKIKKVINKNINKHDENTSNWENLLVHTEYVKLLRKALKLREEKKEEEAHKAYDAFYDFLKQNEFKLRKVYDVFDTPSTLERKIFKQK